MGEDSSYCFTTHYFIFFFLQKRQQLYEQYEKEREKNRPDVSAVLVGIGKDNYLVIFKVIDVEIVAEPRAQCAYKSPEFLVFKDFVD